MILARWRWLNVNKTYGHSAEIPPTRTSQTYVSPEQKLVEPFDKTNVTVGDPLSLISIVKPPMKNIWHMIRRISGKLDPAATSHLIVNNTTIEQPTEIADTGGGGLTHTPTSVGATKVHGRQLSEAKLGGGNI